MFKTKAEVDRHVENSVKRINNETERNLRCFAFAKLYFNIGEYDQARRYISSYLGVKPKSPEGHALLGKILEKLGKKEAALEAYRTSLHQDPRQNSLVIKVCELLASDEVDLEQAGAKYFCDLAQTLEPNNPAILQLKERLITTVAKDHKEVTQLLLKELEWRPTDVNLRVKLLKHFLQNNMVQEAYKHVSDIEEKKLSIFENCLSWYEVTAEVLLRYQRESKNPLNWEFWFLIVSILDKLVSLSLDEHTDTVKQTSDYVTATFNFDQMLSKALQNVNGCQDRILVQNFTVHYQAQLHLHLATLALKQAKKDLMRFKEAVNVVLPVLLIAYQVAPLDLQSVWFGNAGEQKRKTAVKWHKEGAYRCSQAGHILLGLSKDRKTLVLEKATQYSTGSWRENLFKKLFVTRDQHLKTSQSYFTSSNLEPVIRLPDPSDLIKYDEMAQYVHPDSLHHYIWLSINNKLTDFTLKSFEGLQYSVKNLNNCAAETLNVLDVQTFIYCATLCAKSKRDDNRHLVYYNQEKPPVLPAGITECLGTINQAKFLSAAYKMYKNEPSANLGEIRLILIKGIEVIRCVGHHGLDVKVLVSLANIFSEKASKSTKQSEIEANSARAELYWKTALPLLEKIRNNQSITYPSNRLFEYRTKEMSISDAINHIEKGKLFSAIQLMKHKEYEKSLKIFETLKDPYASFYQAQIYKTMADQKTNQSRENVTSEMRSQNIILLSRARDCLYLTLDRLREPSVDKDHALNAQLGSEIETIERLLSRIDPDCNNRNECDGMSDDNVSSDNSIGEHYVTTYTNQANLTPKHEATHHNTHSTPLRSRDYFYYDRIFDRMKFLEGTTATLLTAVNNLTTTLNEQNKSSQQDISEIKKSVNKVQDTVDDLQNMTDVMRELKKEISDLKKDMHSTKASTTQNQQLSDEDLFVLDQEYNALDYNLHPGLYPHVPPARLPHNPTPNPYSALYPGLYPGLAPYPYGLPQAQFIPPEQQLPNVLATLSPYAQNPLSARLTGPTLSLQSPKETFSSPALPNTAVLPTSSVAPSKTSVIQTVTTPSNVVTSKSAPVNVVITSSDPLPTNKIVTSQPVLSVTIPPQHLKGNKTPQAHNYQIPLPTSSVTSITPVVLSTPPPVVSTKGILSTVAPPIFSAINQNKTPKNTSFESKVEVNKNDSATSVSTAAASTSSLGGFVFTSTPTFKTKTVEEKPMPVVPTKDAAPAASPFAGFSFGTTPKSSTATAAVTFTPTVISQNTSKNAEDDGGHVDDFVPTAEFKPVIELPDLIDIKTGEENSEVLFEERAKLFRYDTSGESKEWKERGLGVMKILKDQTVRLLMRREQVLKICCNHQVLKNMAFKQNTTNPKTVVWHAQDFSEGVLKPETFTIRFKTEEQAANFLKTLQNQQTTLDENDKVSSGSKHHKTEAVKNTSFGDKFKLSKGSWECKNCYVANDVKSNNCVACETPKSGVASTKKTDSTAFCFGVKSPSVAPVSSATCDALIKPATSTTTQKMTSGFGDAFKPKSGTWECKICYIRNDATSQYCLSCENPKDDTVPPKKDTGSTLKGINLETPGLKFTFGMPQTTTTVANTGFTFGKPIETTATSNQDKSTPITSTGGLFGTPAGTGFSFGSAPAVTSAPTTNKQPESTDKFVFGSPGKHDFEFKPRSPRKISSGQGEDSDGYAEEEEEDNIYFKPVIPLPDKVDVKTGEEDEEVLYCHRAKLFRFSNGEWKERGLGDIKILKQISSGKLRVVMRREQVLKICLNHVLTSDNEYLAKDEKTWLFHAADYSEGEISRDQFCVRFKNADIAQEFKTAVNRALGAADSTPSVTEQPDDDADSVEIVSETSVTKEEEAEAVKLGLPPKFMSYRQLPDCTCEQCKKDDEYLKELFLPKDKKPEQIKAVPMSNIFGGTSAVKTPSTGDSLFGTPTGKSFSFSSAAGTDIGGTAVKPGSTGSFAFATESAAVKPGGAAVKFGGTDSLSLKELLQTPSSNVSTPTDKSSAGTTTPFGGTPSLFGSAQSTKSIFNTPSNIFSGNTPSSSPGSIFGQPKIENKCTTLPTPTNIFGTAATSTPSNIFGQSNASPLTKSNSILGGTTTPSSNITIPGGSIFGSKPSIFNTGANAAEGVPKSTSTGLFSSTTSSLFGTNSTTTGTSSIFGTTANIPTTKTSIFGSGSSNLFSGTAGGTAGNIFGAKASATPIFGGSNLFGNSSETKPALEATMSFGSTANKGNTDKLTEQDEVVLKCDTGLSFADLASKTNTDAPAFGGGTGAKAQDSTTPFSFLGAGAPVFGGGSTPKGGKNTSKNDGDSDGNEETNESEHDPHFEPIVPLPDMVVVTTGEEDENQLFNERAKLYRFDVNTKEWKERGVGQMKVLYHPQNGTYRLLLRREQVHKVVLNQRVTSDLEVQPMTTSDKAWMWAGYNYTDEENNLEKLAVRFKNVELAGQFKKCIDEAISKVIVAQEEKSFGELPATVQNYGINDNDSATDHENQDGDYVEDEEDVDEEEEEDDDDEKTVMFSKRCTLSEQLPNGEWQTITMGDLQVYYDPDFYAAKITVKDDNGTLFSNTLIGMNTLMDVEKNECRWRAVEWGRGTMKYKNLKATFSSESAAQEFHSNYLEGVNYAQEVGLIDELPTGEDTE